MYYTYLPEIMAQWLRIANVVMKVNIQCGTGFSQVPSKERLLHYFVVYSCTTHSLLYLPLKDANDRKGVDSAILSANFFKITIDVIVSNYCSIGYLMEKSK